MPNSLLSSGYNCAKWVNSPYTVGQTIRNTHTWLGIIKLSASCVRICQPALSLAVYAVYLTPFGCHLNVENKTKKTFDIYSLILHATLHKLRYIMHAQWVPSNNCDYNKLISIWRIPRLPPNVAHTPRKPRS